MPGDLSPLAVIANMTNEQAERICIVPTGALLHVRLRTSNRRTLCGNNNGLERPGDDPVRDWTNADLCRRCQRALERGM